MNSKKKFLIFAVILNSVFFAGVAVWVQRQVDTGDNHRSMAQWLAHNSSHFNRQFINDHREARTLAYQLSQKPTLIEKQKVLLDFDDIEMALEFDGQKTLEVRGQRKVFPFSQDLFTTGNLTFFSRDKDLFFTSFMASSAPSNVHTAITIKKPRSFFDKMLNYSGVTLAIVEQDSQKPQMIFTNLTEQQGQDLLSQFDFEKVGLKLESEKGLFAQNAQYMTLQRQKYLTVTINLSHSDTFRQKLVYLIQAPDYELLSFQQLHLLLWTLFCISVGFTFLIVRKSID